MPPFSVRRTVLARIAADARLLVAHDLHVDESALTGESLAVAKAQASTPADAAVAERMSLVHGGTLVTAGAGAAVVVATGADTELGRIAGLLRATEGVQTPLIEFEKRWRASRRPRRSR
jgi:magnesium-transporting ATPase (P-type)